MIFSNEQNIDLKKNLQVMQNSTKNLMTFNENTLGRPSFNVASPLRDLFKQKDTKQESSNKVNTLSNYLHHQQQTKNSVGNQSTFKVGASPLYEDNSHNMSDLMYSENVLSQKGYQAEIALMDHLQQQKLLKDHNFKSSDQSSTLIENGMLSPESLNHFA